MPDPRSLPSLAFALPLLPSVNHYIDHGRGHKLTPAASAWRNQFLSMLPARIRGCFVVGLRFAVGLTIIPGPGDRGDIDNYSKLILDCCSQAGMLHHPSGRELSDAHIKRLHIDLLDSPEDRVRGPLLHVEIHPL